MQEATNPGTGLSCSLRLSLITLCLCAATADATEVRGNVLTEAGRGAGGATVQVSCGREFSDQQVISTSGTYSLGNVPDNRSCEIRVLRNDVVLGHSSFDSLPGVMGFNWRIKNYGERRFAVLE